MDLLGSRKKRVFFGQSDVIADQPSEQSLLDLCRNYSVDATNKLWYKSRRKCDVRSKIWDGIRKRIRKSLG